MNNKFLVFFWLKGTQIHLPSGLRQLETLTPIGNVKFTVFLNRFIIIYWNHYFEDLFGSSVNFGSFKTPISTYSNQLSPGSLFFTDDKRTVLDVRYKGCYRDGFRSDFEKMIPMKREYLGVRSCTEECHLQGYPYAAVQDARFCMCSRQFGRYGAAEDESQCMTQCIAGSENERCGGPWKNAVYEIGELIGHLHDDAIWLKLSEFISFFIS